MDKEQEEYELKTLEWLLARPEVAKAVDLAFDDQQPEAVQALLPFVRTLLARPRPGARRPWGGRGQQPCGGAAEPPAAAAAAAVAAAVPQGRSCVLVAGLPGCGKSTICSILSEVAGGRHLNQDEWTLGDSGAHESTAFLRDLRDALAHAREGSLLLVDGATASRVQRAELLVALQQARWRRRGGRIFLVRFRHTSDADSQGCDGQDAQRVGQPHIDLCAERVRRRGTAHHVLQPSPQLEQSLADAARLAQAPTSAELTHFFHGCFAVDVEKAAPEAALELLGSLIGAGAVRLNGSLEDLRPRAQVAWQAVQRAEEQWRADVLAAASKPPRKRAARERCPASLEAGRAIEKAMKRVQAEEEQRKEQELQKNATSHSVWTLKLPGVFDALSQAGHTYSGYAVESEPYVALLHIWGDGDDASAKRSQLSLEHFQVMCEALEVLRGEAFDVHIKGLAFTANVVCALVTLPPVLPFAGGTPHVLLASKGLNELARRHAAEALVREAAVGGGATTSVNLPTPLKVSGGVVALAKLS